MGLFGKFGALIISLIGNAQVRILAFKLFLRGLVITMVPLVALLSFNLIFGTIIEWLIAKVDSQTVGEWTTYQLAGLGAYLWIELGLDVVLGLILSACAIRMAFRSIPFLKF